MLVQERKEISIMVSKSNKELFTRDEDNLFKVFLDAPFLRAKDTKFFESPVQTMLELIITPQCNQKCEYCYITQHGHDLYPAHVRADNPTTIKNLKMIMDYFVYKKGYIFKSYQLFAGDMFSTGLFFDTISTIYPYFEYMYDKAPELFKKGQDERIIIIPCNMRFITDDETTKQVREWVDKFAKLNMKLVFSWSHDGKYSCDIREKTEMTDEFYDKVFTFLKETHGGIHPMISYEGIDNAKDNFDWWIEMYEKYFPERVEIGDYMPIPLEVRNNGWTDETITKYLEYLRHRLEKIFDMHEGDVDEVARYLFHVGKYPNLPEYDHFDCVCTPPAKNQSMSCAMQKSVVIRVSDMAVVPCHRLTYHQFIGGWLVPDEETGAIIYEKANNIGQLIDIKSHQVDLAPECCICWNRYNCFHGCLGSQYEWSGELYLPVKSVCKLQKAKTSFILKMLVDTGVLRSALNQDILHEEHKAHLMKLCRKLGYEI
jgi:radical SAM protein with 4Fe4S-binding SPASM domain